MVVMTRRQVVQYGSVAAGAFVAGRALRFAEPASEPLLVEGTTLESTIRASRTAGYRLLTPGPAQPIALRTELAPARGQRADRRVGLATVVQVSDLHTTDVQSPLRFEFLDEHCRTGHRPQELLGTQGAAALVDRINSLRGGPFTGRRLDAVMTTGDNTDNQSLLELEWLLTLLAGGTVHPSSGSIDAFEGVAGVGLPQYWQPEGTSTDRYKAHGFAEIPGLLAAATRPFISRGLAMPWLLTMGNHDDTALGTLHRQPTIAEWCLGDRKVFASRSEVALRLATRMRATTPEATTLGVHDLDGVLGDIARYGDTRTVTADPRRVPFTSADYVETLRDPRYAGAGPAGHGYSPDADGSELYYAHWLAHRVLAISLDTTNQAGGADGSLGTSQLRWLDRTLASHREAYVIVFSHHPSHSMSNLAPDPRKPQERRLDGDELLHRLHEHPNVVAWVNGHSHRNRITPRRHDDPRRSFWEINTVSHIDAPQQARVIEVASNGDGTLSLFTTMIDAASPPRTAYDDLSTTGLASLYRELAFNDLSFMERRGKLEDGNAELMLVDPLA